jgi:hypothetical protein
MTSSDDVMIPLLPESNAQGITYHCHGNAEVRSQLIISIAMAGIVGIFVNTTSVYQRWLFALYRRIGLVCDPEITFEVVF